MLRSALALIAAAGLFVSVPAEACEAHAKKAPTATAPEKKKAHVCASACEHGADGKAASAGAMSEEIDAAMAGKCSCGGAADCTCKKGSCECAKCNKGHRKSEPLYESLKGTRRVPGIENARYDASAGVFI